MKRIAHYSAIAFCFVTLFLGTSLFQPQHSRAAGSGNLTPAEEKVDHLMAGLSDEQVRQMLIDELKKDADLAEPGFESMKGPASILSRMLGGLSSGQDENKDELKDLFSGIPQLLPDLYKVFINL